MTEVEFQKAADEGRFVTYGSYGNRIEGQARWNPLDGAHLRVLFTDDHLTIVFVDPAKCHLLESLAE